MPHQYRLSEMQPNTPYPNALLEQSVVLHETPLRVLNWITRATLGWSTGPAGERRATVVVSLWQLRRAVGRSSALAVAEALVSLQLAGLVELRSEDGIGLSARQLYPHGPRKIRMGIAPEWAKRAPRADTHAVDNHPRDFAG